MKVLYLHQHFSVPQGSTGTRSYEFAKALVAAGHEVTMVCGSFGHGDTGLDGPYRRGVRRGNVAGFTVVEIEIPYSNHDPFLRRAMKFANFALRAAEFAMREPHDLVFATTTPLTIGVPAMFAKFLRGKPFVFEVRDLWPEFPRAMGIITNPAILTALKGLEWTCYRAADACIGLSPGMVDGIASLGVSRDRITMIPNACDLELFHPDKEAQRPEGVSESDFVALYAGTHGFANGLGAVLDVAAELKQRGRSDIKLVFYGDGAKKQELVERATKEGLDNCIFHTPVPKTELPGLFCGANVGLMPLDDIEVFYYGTSPNKFFDYISAGLPIVNNYPGWIADMVGADRCGIAVPPRDPQAFADALEQMADDPEETVRMGANARTLAERDFDRAALAQQFVAWLERWQKS